MEKKKKKKKLKPSDEECEKTFNDTIKEFQLKAKKLTMISMVTFFSYT